MSKKQWRVILVGITIFLISAAGYKKITHERSKIVHAMPLGLVSFDVLAPVPHCGRWKDNMPKSRDFEMYRLYIAARKYWRSKVEWQFSKEELAKILADVMLASEKGDWGARALLSHFYLQGLGPLPSNLVLKVDESKSVALARTAMEVGQPWGFYDVGVAHEHGYGGAHYDQKIAWAYYLKAAQLGSPEAQLTLAAAYAKAKRPDAEHSMIRCAYLQGYGPAAFKLALRSETGKKYFEALKLHQEGVKFGSGESAAFLYLLFGDSAGRMLRAEFLPPLGLSSDSERFIRYKQIQEALELNPDLRFSRIDSFLPLPPANLPTWPGIDGVKDLEPAGPPAY